VIRSDTGDAHRLSLSARVLSTVIAQVKAKATTAEALLTSVKTLVERDIWALSVLTAIEPTSNGCGISVRIEALLSTRLEPRHLAESPAAPAAGPTAVQRITPG
jgi:hypothetical protein